MKRSLTICSKRNIFRWSHMPAIKEASGVFLFLVVSRVFRLIGDFVAN